ncbi:MAG: nuclear transport factor 2 family protein, partial [Solirubrobacteraceae bacterium]
TQIGHGFIEAFNLRDAEAMVALTHPELEFRPTMLAGSRRVYKGHDGLRTWVADLVASGAEHQVRVREVRVLGEQRLIVFTEVLLDGEAISPSAMVATLRDGKIVEARAYLSDEETLAELDLLR